MKAPRYLLPFVALFVLPFSTHGKMSPEEKAKHEKIRQELPLGGNFEPAKEEGVFVTTGHGLNVFVSRDDGKTWHWTSPYDLKAKYKGTDVDVTAGHPAMAYGDGRIIVVGGNGPSVYSDDLGETWDALQADVEKWEGKGAKSIAYKDGVWVILKGDGSYVLRSTDKGKTWKAHPLGIEKPAGRTYALSVVGDEFWAVGETSKASNDGIAWRELADGIPVSQIAESEKGTLIGIARRPARIWRSEDRGATWDKVFEDDNPDVEFADVEFGYVKKVE